MVPEFGRSWPRAPHSPILAPCHAPPAWQPLASGSADMIAVSVVRPAITISAPVSSAAWIAPPLQGPRYWSKTTRRHPIFPVRGSAE
ncbi:Hypothetical protein FKW44_016303 [Caligus rogercresseyi]|uniref:Uncharacterized protein n=1 Tax=Caligus rogercresseyi TaxID=217165 RepID=A0A7T8K0C7_CALRO|nr:Hypothetical protein FKW44_016303 [Caligus rogercresseyi]